MTESGAVSSHSDHGPHGSAPVDRVYLYEMPFVDTDGDGRFTASVTFLSDFDGAWKEAILSALDTWESVTNIDFSTQISAAENAITFAFGDVGSGWGYAYDVDVYFKYTVAEIYLEALALHEIGHVIGLGHQSRDSVMRPGVVASATVPTANDLAITDALFGPKSADAGATAQSGGVGAQEIIGNAGSDILYGNQGSDTLLARGGDDTLFGGQDADLVQGGAGADVLYGNLGADVLSGGDGADTLFGGQADDTLSGGDGDDLMFGNRGADLYVPGAGADTIVGFDPGEGDRLSGSALSIAAVGDDALVTFSDGSTVILLGIQPEQLDGALV